MKSEKLTRLVRDLAQSEWQIGRSAFLSHLSSKCVTSHFLFIKAEFVGEGLSKRQMVSYF